MSAVMFSVSMDTADNQVLIVELGALPLLHNIMIHYLKETLSASVACLRNLSIHRANEVIIYLCVVGVLVYLCWKVAKLLLLILH